MFMTCPFCNAKEMQNKIWYETKGFRCIYNHKPILPGHSLLISKRHVESFLDLEEKEMQEFSSMIKTAVNALLRAYGCRDFNISLQNGEYAGASVAHVHWHLIPRKKGDIEGDPSAWHAKILEAERKRKPISDEEIRKNVERIRASIKEIKNH